MLYLPKTSLVRVTPRDVLLGGTINAEGAALIVTSASGNTNGYTQSNGSAGEIFGGVAVYEKAPLTSLPRVDDLIADDTAFTITLPRTPVGGTSAMRVLNETGGSVVLTAGDPTSDATKYSLSGSVITVNSALASATIRVHYRYSPTVMEARTIQGDTRPGGLAEAIYGKVGVLSIGDVYTSEYDQTVGWSAANVVIKTGANGRFTIGGSGTTVNANIIAQPTVDFPWLGITLL